MRILWFTNTTSNFNNTCEAYNGRGWISSLESELSNRDDVELGIAFLNQTNQFKVERDNVTYYLISQDKALLSRFVRFFALSRQDEELLDKCTKIINDFKPDIITIFGTENVWGRIVEKTDIPCIIHIQGIMNPCINAWVPPKYSLIDYFLSSGLSLKKIILRIRAYLYNKHAATRELRIIRSCKNFMGRTDWDKTFVSLYSPHAKYYYCQEIMRAVFYDKGIRKVSSKPVFISTLSNPLYKGHDMVLKTAKLLKDVGVIDFEWKVFGIKDMSFAEEKTKIRAAEVNVKCCGIATAEELKRELLGCSVYVHTSYIDNSPNSVCEALLLDTPVVATNVGGVSSIVTDGVDGLLVPPNDPMVMAKRIKDILDGHFVCRTVDGKFSHKTEIANNLIKIYKDIIRDEKDK